MCDYKLLLLYSFFWVFHDGFLLQPANILAPDQTLLVATLLFVNLLCATILLSIDLYFVIVYSWAGVKIITVVFCCCCCFQKKWLSLATLQTTTGLASYMSQVANICQSQHIFSPISRAAISHVIFQLSLILCLFSMHAFLCPSCHLGFHWWEYCNWNTEAAVRGAFAHYCQWDKSYLPVLHAIRSDTWLHWLF